MSIYTHRDIKDKLFFAHVPKAAGTSVKTLLQDHGWEVSRIKVPEHLAHEVQQEAGYTKHPHRLVWQQIEKDWQFEFSVVRNPYNRAISQLNQDLRNPMGLHHCMRLGGHTVKNADPIEVLKWLNNIMTVHIPRDGFGMDDNHWRPQVDFIAEDTVVYRMEDELEELLKTLKIKGYIPSDAKLSLLNAGEETLKNTQSNFEWALCPDVHEKFLEYYLQDFKHFGYTPEVLP